MLLYSTILHYISPEQERNIRNLFHSFHSHFWRRLASLFNTTYFQLLTEKLSFLYVIPHIISHILSLNSSSSRFLSDAATQVDENEDLVINGGPNRAGKSVVWCGVVWCCVSLFLFLSLSLSLSLYLSLSLSLFLSVSQYLLFCLFLSLNLSTPLSQTHTHTHTNAHFSS